MATTDQLLSRLNIEVRGIALCDESVPLMMQLIDVMRRAAAYGGSAREIIITVNEPDTEGSAMFAMHVIYRDGGEIHIGALRRTPLGDTEFHS